MKIAHRSLLYSVTAAYLLAYMSCTPAPPSRNNNQANGNSGAQQNANSQANANTLRGEIKTPPPGPGTANIEITSTPRGADVILIPLREDGADPPRQYGFTPATVNVPVGKYLINLEMSGYRYFQQQVVLKDRETRKVNATLKKR